MDDYHGKRVTVMGLGCFGGGVGVARFFARRGARVTVTDLNSPDQLRPSLDQLGDVPIAAFHLGEHVADDFTHTDLVVVNPAVPGRSPFLDTARRHGVALTSEICLFFQHCRAPIIGVTGSNGKSTTTALIHALLQSVWKGRGGGGDNHESTVWLGGNIGRSLLPQVDDIKPDDLVVLELSSFQLEQLATIRKSPHVAVVTNFTPNHLDRHGTLQAYRDAKQNILRFQRPTDLALLNRDDPDVAQWGCRTAARVLYFTLAPGHTEFADRFDTLLTSLALPGRHNQRNALAALTTVCALTEAEPVVLRNALASFRGLPHRLELVAEFGGRTFYNDSIATTPESTVAALDSFDCPVILIAGGYDKGIDLAPVARRVPERAKAVALIGQTARALADHLREDRRASRSAVNIHLAVDIDDAVRWAWAQSVAGDIILLSPACASYDQFRNFEHRGEIFRQAVSSVKQSHSMTAGDTSCVSARSKESGEVA